jgi:uncharacterized protein YndB with AHSA1/START domain
MTDAAMTDAVRIERVLDAPAASVWRMWTDPEQFRTWYGPDGAAIPVAELDVRVGGQRRVCMEVGAPGEAMRMWFTGEHREVVENERLVYTEAMDGGEATMVVVELEDLGGRTRMVLTHHGVPVDSPGAAGWAMAFAKLTARLRDAGER